ncbi:hypothetical protein Tco_0414699 [Tanacetum coccineum]
MTLSLDELRSPDFNLLSDQEYSKEEEAEAMEETMEQYMSKTRNDYGSGVARPKIDNKDQFELKGQGVVPTRLSAGCLKLPSKKCRKNTPKWHMEHLEKDSTEILDGIHWLYTSITKQSRKRDQEEATTLDFIQMTQRKSLQYKERRQSNGDTTNAAIRNHGASIKTLEIQIGQMSKVLQERGFESLPSSTKTNLRDQVKSISTTIKADSHLICHIRSSQYAVSTRQNSKLLYKSRQTTIPFPIRLDNHYCEEEEGTMDQNLRNLMELHISITSYIERRKTQGVSLYLALLIIFALTIDLVDLGVSR